MFTVLSQALNIVFFYNDLEVVNFRLKHINKDNIVYKAYPNAYFFVLLPLYVEFMETEFEMIEDCIKQNLRCNYKESVLAEKRVILEF